MKIDIRMVRTGADFGVYVATKEGPRYWMILRGYSNDRRIAGYVGTPGLAGLAAVRPVTVSSIDISESMMVPYAIACLVKGSFLGLQAPSARRESRSDQVNAWEAFLDNREAVEPKDVDTKSIEIDDTILAEMTRQGLVRLVGDQGVSLINVNRIKVGRQISGFDAARVQTSVAQVLEMVDAPDLPRLGEATEALKAVTRPTSRAVAWYGAATDEQITPRLQAASAFPVLAGMIADHPIMANAVDEQQSLQPLIIERTGISKGGLKRLGKLTAGLPVGRLFDEGQEVRGEDALGVNRARRFNIAGEVSIDQALQHLAVLPPDRVPADDEQWKFFHDILAGCALPLEYGLDVPVEKTLAACKGDWKAFHATLAKAADFEPEAFTRRAMALVSSDAIEAIGDFAFTAVLPLALTSVESVDETVGQPMPEHINGALEVARKTALGESKNVAASAFEIARRFSSRIPALMEAVGLDYGIEVTEGEGLLERYGTSSFPVLTGDFTASNGLVVRPLPDHAHMVLESERLGHCVGLLYLTKAWKTKSHIYSVQSADGQVSHSTLELKAIGSAVKAEACADIAVIQHNAAHNRPPSEAATAAGNEFLMALKRGDLAMNLDEIMQWREVIQETTLPAQQGSQVSRIVSWQGVLGFDWRDAERRAAAWQEWRGIIGGAVGKGAVPDALYRHKEAQQLVRTINPTAAVHLAERALQARRQRQEEADAVPSP